LEDEEGILSGSTRQKKPLLMGFVENGEAGAFDQQRKSCLPIYTHTKKQSCAISEEIIATTACWVLYIERWGASYFFYGVKPYPNSGFSLNIHFYGC
jgi:hypothetical protein